jgi:hypothetical protein
MRNTLEEQLIDMDGLLKQFTRENYA